ncbi:GNAT family N-acetyltransferase [Thalassobaculum sp.]|uniref:GNAT family N-acetyltransferase n=1 Tax=Thalassobaculum sp. TaxID=2022740 RepID=UPI0032EEAF24
MNIQLQLSPVAGDAMAPSAVTVRPTRPEDAGRIAAICYEAFKVIAEWHRFPPDFPNMEAALGFAEHALSRPDVYGVVAEVDGRVVGSNFLWEADYAAGVGPITVDPQTQNSAVGRRLMTAVLDRAQVRGIDAVRLVQAAYHTRSLSLYAKLGFAVREPLALLQGTPPRLVVDGRRVRSATEADLPEANHLCVRVHGHHRAGELAASVRQGTAMVVERRGAITGYTTGIGFFGHAVANGDADIRALIAAAPSYAGPGFLVPMRDSDLLHWCLENGLRVVQMMTLMTRGSYREPEGAYLPSILY